MTDDTATAIATNSPEGWAYVPAREVLRILGPDAVIATNWDQFVQAHASAPGIPGHAIVVAVAPRGTASPLLDLVRGAQNQPVRMSCSLAATERYFLLSPPTVVCQWRERSDTLSTERAAEQATFQNLLDAAKVGLKEKELAEAAYKRYGRGASNLRIRYRRRLTHCMHCRESLDSEVHILECRHCGAIVCPFCGSCGCGDSRFARIG